jgi:hypothetical protein
MPLRCSELFAASVVIANSRNIERTVGAATEGRPYSTFDRALTAQLRN